MGINFKIVDAAILILERTGENNLGIVEIVKIHRFRWSAHADRMNEPFVPRRMWKGQIDGRRKGRWRIRICLQDNIVKDADELFGVREAGS